MLDLRKKANNRFCCGDDAAMSQTSISYPNLQKTNESIICISDCLSVISFFLNSTWQTRKEAKHHVPRPKFVRWPPCLEVMPGYNRCYDRLHLIKLIPYHLKSAFSSCCRRSTGKRTQQNFYCRSKSDRQT